jgi:quercetin dioxygenase-like cupin family protein
VRIVQFATAGTGAKGHYSYTAVVLWNDVERTGDCLSAQDAQVVVSIYGIMPGATLQAHNHPYPRYGYVLSGTLRVNNIETGQTDTYKPGNFILESVGQWHAATSVGEEPLKLLVIDVVEKGQPNTVLLN